MRVFEFADKVVNYLYRKAWLKKAKKNGALIGDHTVFTDLRRSKVDATRPWLLEIGDYCVISVGATILTHDYSLSTLRRVYGEWIGEGRITRIGDNCFIGMDTVITMGTTIGDNVIVGAGSVVRGRIPSNVVVAGNPATVICSLEEYYHKRKERSIHEAVICAEQYYKRFQRKPRPADLSGFKFLFCPRNERALESYNLNFDCSGDEPIEVKSAFFESEPYWQDFDAFLDECDFKENNQ